MVTILEQLEAALPDVLAPHEQDLIDATATGRVLVVMHMAGYHLPITDPDGGIFRWLVRTFEVQEIAEILTDPSVVRVGAGVEVIAGIARCWEQDLHPIVLLGDGVKLVGLKRGGAIS